VLVRVVRVGSMSVDMLSVIVSLPAGHEFPGILAPFVRPLQGLKTGTPKG